MIVTCEQCQSSFKLDDSLVKETGTKVRCSKCKHIFVVYPPEPETEPTGADEAEETPAALQETSEDTLDTAGFDAEETPRSEVESKIEDFDPAGTTQDEGEEDDLDLGIDTEGEADELDLSDLDLDDAPTAEDESEDLDLGIDTEDEADELDLSDLDLDDAPTAEDESEDLDLGIDTEDEEDDLDLSDLDLDDTPTAEDESEDLDLGIDTEDEGEEDELDLSIEAEEEQEDIDLSGIDIEDTPQDDETGAEKTEELDLSDIDKMLETYDGEVPEEERDAEPEELDLDIDLEPVESEAAEDTDVESDEDFDLSDLDQMLDEAESAETAEETLEDIDLDLGADDETAPEEEPLEDLDFSLDIEEAEESGKMTEVSEEMQPAASETETDHETKEFYAETIEIDRLGEESQAPVEGAPAAPGPDAAESPAEKKKLGKPVMVLLILLLVAGIAAGAYFVLDMLGVQVPFVSDLMPSETMEVDRIEVLQNTLSANFVDNADAGRLFVVKGEVKNGHSEPRRFIEVTGRLYRQNKVPGAEVSVFAGNVLSDMDLTNLPYEQIAARLKVRTGQNQSNVNVQPGRTLPFMIVFHNLPQDLEEYEIESSGSLPAQ